MDERASDQLSTIEKGLGLEHFHRITGKPASGNLTLLKIIWLREHEPNIFQTTTKFLDVAAFLNHKLTGNCATGRGIADPTGLLDMEKEGWAAPILDFAGLNRAQLPRTVAHGKLIGEVTSQAAQACGLPVGLPVIAGVGDGQAAGLGANIVRPGQTYLSLGTSVVSGSYTHHYVVDQAFRTLFAADGKFSLETVILGGTYTLNWLQENFSNGASLKDLEREADEIIPGSEGLTVVPYWNSVMNPYWDATARGITIGWQGSHRPAHFYRAILEGLAFELKLHFDGVEAALSQIIEKMIVTGGGAQSDLWCQIISDICGKTIHRAQIPEATALGAGILAAAGAGIFPSIQQAAQHMATKPNKHFSPKPENQVVYTQIYKQIYLPIFPRLRSIFQKQSSLMEN
jgi:xylulokinase